MSAPVDVLSVLRRLSANVEFASLKHEATAAIDALFELAGAATPFALLLGPGQMLDDAFTEHTVTVRMSDVRRLRAALAQIGGE